MDFCFRFRAVLTICKFYEPCVVCYLYVLCTYCNVCMHAGTCRYVEQLSNTKCITADINTGIRNTVAFKFITKYVNMKQVSYVVNSCLL
jgi:hypothetical protein